MIVEAISDEYLYAKDYYVENGNVDYNTIAQLIRKIPCIDTSNMTKMNSMFSNCNNLIGIPTLNTTNVTNMTNMFYRCYELQLVQVLETSNVTTMENMFYLCKKIQTVCDLDCKKVTSISGMFSFCNKLQNLGGLKDLGNSYSVSQPANFGLYTLDLKNCPLTYKSLMNVINNLYDIKTAGIKTQSLTLGSTNISKLTAEEIAIATEKGWTVS